MVNHAVNFDTLHYLSRGNKDNHKNISKIKARNAFIFQPDQSPPMSIFLFPIKFDVGTQNTLVCF